jgi:hypothetical protein
MQARYSNAIVESCYHGFTEDYVDINDNKGKIKESALDLGTDVGNLALEPILDATPFKEFPVLGWIVKGANLYKSLHDYVREKKLITFLLEFERVPPKTVEKTAAKLREDAKYQEEIGSLLVMLIDRLNDFEKPKLVAKVFAAFLSGSISLEEFRRLGDSIDLAYIDDLKRLAQRDSFNEKQSPSYFDNLTRSGLTAVELPRGGSMVSEPFVNINPGKTILTALGTLFVAIMNDEEIEVTAIELD